jgi:single-strand DNA-binding protein
MANVNVVCISGNLTRDPELRHTQGGTPVCSMRLAHNDRAKVNGEWTDVPYYFDITVWGNQGEACANYLSKGRGVVVQGRLTWREWEAREGGGKRQAVEIVAERVQWLPAKDGSGGGSSDHYTGGVDYSPSSQATPADTPDFVPGSQDDDIPF